jgi:hypothetical protein
LPTVAQKGDHFNASRLRFDAKLTAASLFQRPVLGEERT